MAATYPVLPESVRENTSEYKEKPPDKTLYKPAAERNNGNKRVDTEYHTKEKTVPVRVRIENTSRDREAVVVRHG